VRVVIDPGVLIAALLSPSGSPARLVRRWLAGEVEVVASPVLLKELGTVLKRDKFRRWLTLGEAEAFVRLIGASAVNHEDPEAPLGLAPDPGDAYLVALAIATRVEGLVTGDAVLLAADLHGLVTFTPAELLTILDHQTD
jgi:putative PIN family toxin of toxin-antitoxin system